MRYPVPLFSMTTIEYTSYKVVFVTWQMTICTYEIIWMVHCSWDTLLHKLCFLGKKAALLLQASISFWKKIYRRYLEAFEKAVIQNKVCKRFTFAFYLITKYMYTVHSSLVDYLAQVINVKNYPVTFYCIFHLVRMMSTTQNGNVIKWVGLG